MMINQKTGKRTLTKQKPKPVAKVKQQPAAPKAKPVEKPKKNPAQPLPEETVEPEPVRKNPKKGKKTPTKRTR